MTRQRALIYRTICMSEEHLTAEEIYLRARREMPALAIGTVYRNLKLMVEAEQIRRVEIHGEPDRYDRNLRDHDHLVCARCGRIADVCLTGIRAQLEQAVKRPILGYDLNIRYVCDECRSHDKLE